MPNAITGGSEWTKTRKIKLNFFFFFAEFAARYETIPIKKLFFPDEFTWLMKKKTRFNPVYDVILLRDVVVR